MNTRTPHTLAAAAVLGLVLTSCGQGTQEDPTTSPAETTAAAATSPETTPAASPTDETTADAGDETSADAAASADTPSSYPAGEDYWFYSPDSAIGKFTLPDPEPYAPAERLREQVGGQPVSYVTVTVDNRNGMSGVNMYELAAFDEDGAKYTFQSLEHVLNLWSATLGIETDEEISLYNEFVDLTNEHMSYADVGQVEEFIMASEEADLPESFTRVTVQPHGAGEPTDVFPTSDSQGIDLSFEAPQD